MSEDDLNPRTRRVRREILDAAIALLLDHGANEVTAARIASETGVARTTIYRQWPDQPSLLLATIEELVVPHAEGPDSGDLRADLHEVLIHLRYRLVGRKVRTVMAALIGQVATDPAFLDAQRRFVAGLVTPTVDVLERAVQRGELPPTFDCLTAATVVTSPLLGQYLLAVDDISDELIDQAVAQFVATHL